MREIAKKSDIYTPTEAEKRILMVCIDPDSFTLNITQRCEKADVSRETWYKTMKKQDFIKMLNQMLMDNLRGKIGDVINATYKYATSDSKNSADRKILMTMAGLYSDKLDANVHEDITIKVKKPEINGFGEIE